MSKWKRWGRIWAGALSALLVGWSAIAFGLWLTSLAWTALHPPPSLLPPTEYIAGFGLLWMIAFIPIGFAMGFICALFWHNMEPLQQQYGWGKGLSLVFFLPIVIMEMNSFWFLLFAFPMFLCALHYGLSSHARLPHFLGLTSEWERDENDD